MNNFSDLLDINDCIHLTLTVTPVKVPEIIIKINNKILWDGVITESTSIVEKISLLDSIDISISLRNKNYDVDNLSALIVDQLSIDNFNFVPGWTHLIDYKNDHDYSDPTNYLGFNGTWGISIKEPFYQWVHKVQGHGWLLKP